MKECAIDCRILQSFHTSTGNDLKCEMFKEASPNKEVRRDRNQR